MHPGEERIYNFWVMVFRAPDVDGQWVAHCLELDVVTQGNSVGHAVRMAHEAIQHILLDDLNHGRDPLERRAPQEHWNELYEFIGKCGPSKRITAGVLDSMRINKLAVQLEMHVECFGEESDQLAAPERPSLPIPMAFSESVAHC